MYSPSIDNVSGLVSPIRTVQSSNLGTAHANSDTLSSLQKQIRNNNDPWINYIYQQIYEVASLMRIIKIPTLPPSTTWDII